MAKVRAYQIVEATNSESAASVTSHSVKDFAARAKNIRDQLCRKRGTLSTFEDKLTVLKLYQTLFWMVAPEPITKPARVWPLDYR